MADIIQLLPDSIANQIAAGEVIQRPASVVKELMENAIDAGATEIKLIVKDSGKTMIQVIDNGKGMSESDARMSFERHATSKIRAAADLFSIHTMGFRGEALASIAAIAHVDLITRTPESEVGSHLVVRGSKVEKQEICQAAPGTTFTVRNLFYNVPARRKFLKSDPVELRHVMEEFHRVVLAHPDIFFVMHHNDNETYHLPASNLRQRIINVFGKLYNERVVPVHEDTDSISIEGFIGKPEASKKTKGEQYIFVNKRFIKSYYLNHAIRSAFEELITKDQHPFYVLFLEMDPAGIDVNVHPTKTEIKFEEERLIYNYVKVSIKHALGQYNVIPAIDFEVDYNFSRPQEVATMVKPSRMNEVDRSIPELDKLKKDNVSAWQSMYDGLDGMGDTDNSIRIESKFTQQEIDESESQTSGGKAPYHLHNSYIITQIKSGFLVIDQQSAHERILYDQYLKSMEASALPTQKQLFPVTIELNNARAELLKSILDKVNVLGFEVEEFGESTFIIHGIPVGMESAEKGSEMIEKLIDQYESNLEFQLGINENVARSMAISAGMKKGKSMTIEERNALIDQLFACEIPYKSPSGKKCFVSIELDELMKRFKEV